MVGLLAVVIGFAIMLDSKAFATKLLHGVAALVVGLSLLPCLLAQAGGAATSSGCRAAGAGILGDALPLALLVVVGFVLWKLRHALAERRHEQARRWGTPRDRAVPPAPQRDADDRRHAS